MKLAINQPYFLPYIGLMEKAKFADLFLINDFSRISVARSNHRRVTIISNNKYGSIKYLTELVYRQDDNKPFNQIELDEEFYKRIKEIINAIIHAYARAPFYSYLSKELYECLGKRYEYLGEYNYQLIKLLLRKLNINTKIVLMSELGNFNQNELENTPPTFKNHATYMSFQICKAFSATTYISGQNGPNYLDETFFEEAGIEVIHQKLHFKSYPQFNNQRNFIEGLSVIDLLFNLGPTAGDFIGRNSTFKQIKNR